jgi:hypothetical protein
LERSLSMPTKYLYMGVNPDSGNHLLPTTRFVRALKRARGVKDDAGPPDPAKLYERPKGALGRARACVKSSLRLANRLAEEWYRQAIAVWHRARGRVVIFDRHFFADFYAHDVEGGERRSSTRRVHGFLLRRIYPRPDLVIYLDAPAQVLFDRKGEGTIASLEKLREEYLALRDVVPAFAQVDGTQPVEAVTADVAELIITHRKGHRATL